MKTICRVLIGAALLYPAYGMHTDAQKQSDKAIGVNEMMQNEAAPPAVRKREPYPDDTDFFGDDPRERVKKPEVKKQLQEAVTIDQRAVMIAALGVVIILWPLLYRVLRLLFSENKEVANGESSPETRYRVRSGESDSGNLPKPADPGGSEGREGGGLPGGDGSARVLRSGQGADGEAAQANE